MNKTGIKGKNSNLNLVLFIILIVLVLIIMFLYFTNINNKSQINKLSQGELKSLGVYNQEVKTLDANVITSCGAVLNQPNTVYTLNSDIIATSLLDNCITINATGVTLDCQKNRIWVSFITGDQKAVVYSNQPSTTIKNCELIAKTPIKYSIILTNADYSNIINNSFNQISISQTKYSNIKYNKMVNQDGQGILMMNSQYNTLSNNIIENSTYNLTGQRGGIFLSRATNNNITDNIFKDNFFSGSIIIDDAMMVNYGICDNNTIANNLFINNNRNIKNGEQSDYSQIVIGSGCLSNTLKNNEIINNKGTGVTIGRYKMNGNPVQNTIVEHNFIYNQISIPGTYCNPNYYNFDCNNLYYYGSCLNFPVLNTTGKGNIISSNSYNLHACVDNSGNSYWPILGTDYSENINDCIPDCHKSDGTLKTCGSNECGNLNGCGTCNQGQTCEFGNCVAACTPDCTGKGCGDDNGCGQKCGCSFGQSCVNNQCEVVCIPKTCSDYSPGTCGAVMNGCGGCLSCVCTSGQRCSNGLCVNDPLCVSNPSSCLTGADMCGSGTCSTDNDVLSCVNHWANV